MAEILGATASALTIAGEFKICLGAFDFIQATRALDTDARRLTLKLNIERCRLLIWGQNMGLVQGLTEGAATKLYEHPFADVVRETLESIFDLLNDSEHLSGKYGCCKVKAAVDAKSQLITTRPQPSERLVAAFGKLNVVRKIEVDAREVSKKAKWAIHDKNKFELLLREAKGFIDSLEILTRDLTTQRKHQEDFVSSISTIGDTEALGMIAEVCQFDHSTFSEAASQHADKISVGITEPLDILDWIRGIESSKRVSTVVEDVESWPIAELRSQYLALLRQRPPGANRGVVPDYEGEIDSDSSGWSPGSDLMAIDPSKLAFCRVMSNYIPSGDSEFTELQVRCGEIIAVLSKLTPLGDPSRWWFCRTRDARMGYLLSSHLEIIKRRIEPLGIGTETRQMTLMLG